MSLKNFSLLEAVELAINMEQEGVRFYSLAADKVKDAKLAELFTLLKDREYDHINTFRKLYTDISGRAGGSDAALYLLDPEIASYFRAFVESTVFPVKGAAEGAIAKAEGPADVLRLGMQIEKDSILYYQELKQHSPYPEASEVLDRIIVEEREHFNSLHAMWRELPGDTRV